MPRPEWDAVPAAAGQYGTTEGEPELREAIASRARGLGLRCDAAQVLVLSGLSRASTSPRNSLSTRGTG